MASEPRIPIARPWLGVEEEQAAASVIRSGWLISGAHTQAFELSFAQYCKARHAVALNTCTHGLHLALRAVGVGPGDVVLTVSHSFIATANAVRLAGAEPVFVDVDPDTANLSPAALRRILATQFDKDGDGALVYRDVKSLALGESPLANISGRIGRLAAILLVHQVGLPAEIDSILDAADGAGVPVVEDAACALGSMYRSAATQDWLPIGANRGTVACFSFHPRKVITTGEGGMVTTDNSAIAKRINICRQHGMDQSPHERHVTRDLARNLVREEYLATSNNYRMTDMQAAMGEAQMTRLDAIVERRRTIATIYKEALAGSNNLRLPFEPSYARSNFQSFIIGFRDSAAARRTAAALDEKGIDVRPGIMNAHEARPYQAIWKTGDLPVSEMLSATTLTIPLFPTMTETEIGRVVAALQKIG